MLISRCWAPVVGGAGLRLLGCTEDAEPKFFRRGLLQGAGWGLLCSSYAHFLAPFPESSWLCWKGPEEGEESMQLSAHSCWPFLAEELTLLWRPC